MTAVVDREPVLPRTVAHDSQCAGCVFAAPHFRQRHALLGRRLLVLPPTAPLPEEAEVVFLCWLFALWLLSELPVLRAESSRGEMRLLSGALFRLWLLVLLLLDALEKLPSAALLV